MKGRRQRNGRDVSGILLLDKPVGITSNGALQRVKRLFRAQKAGHTGSLDPLASGLLPICLGEATKISAFLLDADKRYRVRLKLGSITTTGDREGEVIETKSVPSLSRRDVERTLSGFVGSIQQVPPMYSALKYQGERLYNLARKGVEVERPRREVTIFSLDLLSLELPEMELDVHCTKGTYIRTLAEDVGQALGSGAHVTALRRTGVGPFGEEQMVSSETLENEAEKGPEALDSFLYPIDSALQHWPEVVLSPDATFYLKQGQSVLVPRSPTEGWVRVYSADRGFLGAGLIDEDGKVAPKRLMGGKS